MARCNCWAHLQLIPQPGSRTRLPAEVAADPGPAAPDEALAEVETASR